MAAPQYDERRVYHLDLELRDVDDKSRRVMMGLAAPYDEPTPIGSAYIEVLAPGVFKRSIDHLNRSGRSLPLHMFHDHATFPVGKSLEWEDRSAGLFGSWELLPEGMDEMADKGYRMMMDGFVNGLSVGFQSIRSDVDPGSDTRPPVVTRREARLFETSVVSAGAYASAQIMLVRTAGLDKPARPHLERWKQWREGQA